MPKETKEQLFAWSTVGKHRRSAEVAHAMSVSIIKTGFIYLPKDFVNGLDIQNGFYKLMVDMSRRTVGLKFYDKVNLGEVKELRKFNIKAQGTFVISAQSLLRDLEVLGKAVHNLPIKEVKDPTFGQMFIFKVPKKVDEEKEVTN